MRANLWLSAALLSVALAVPGYAETGPYKVVQTVRVGGPGGFDFVYADVDGRSLYIPRTGDGARITVFDLDTLAPKGEIAGANARGVAVDPVSHHGFSSSKPVVMWDTATLKPLKSIDVQGRPDVILFDPFNERVWVFSHTAPNATIIDAKDGSVIGTLDLGGEPEQAVSDGKGRIFVDLEDKDQVAAIDAAGLKVVSRYGLDGKGGGPSGLAFDAKNRVLFVTGSEPATMVMLNADSGRVLGSVPIGQGTDGATFNPATMEAFSAQADGTLTIVKETGPAAFAVEQNMATQKGAKTLTLDDKTGRILLITATYGPAAPTAAGERPRRGPMVPDSFSIIAVGR